MVNRKVFYMGSLILLILTTGCSNKSKVHKKKRRTTVDKNNIEYKIGTADGCKTAKGEYTKDHAKFKVDLDYHEGWFNGRQRCQIAIW